MMNIKHTNYKYRKDQFTPHTGYLTLLKLKDYSTVIYVSKRGCINHQN